MTVIAVQKDADALTMTVDAEFDASPDRVWQLWADPRQLERWWGPPTYPATFTKHELAPGSRVEYHMTGPEGDQPKGFWDIVEVAPPHRLVVHDGFRNDDGTDNADLPANEFVVTIAEAGTGRTRMSIESRFPSREAMELIFPNPITTPARRSMVNEQLYAGKGPANWKVFYDTLDKFPDTGPIPAPPQVAEVEQVLLKHTGTALSSPRAVRPALRRMQRDLEKAMEREI